MDKLYIEVENEFPLFGTPWVWLWVLPFTATSRQPRIASQNEESETEHAAEIEKGFTKTEGKCHSAGMCSKPFQVNGSWGWILKEPHL